MEVSLPQTRFFLKTMMKSTVFILFKFVKKQTFLKRASPCALEHNDCIFRRRKRAGMSWEDNSLS